MRIDNVIIEESFRSGYTALVRPMNVQKINKTNVYPPHPGGSSVPGGVWGSKFQKCGKFHELPRKSINKKNYAEKITKTCNPHPPHPTGGGVRGEHFKVTKLQGLKSNSGMQLT